MEFSYDLSEEGWASVRIADGAGQLEFTCSRLSDALGDLAKGAAMLLGGSREEACALQDEPGEYRFLFTRGESDSLTIHILWFEKSFSGRANRFGQEVFRCECAVLDFVGQLFASLHRILVGRGLEGYRMTWRNHDFPVRAYEAIRQRLQPVSNLRRAGSPAHIPSWAVWRQDDAGSQFLVEDHLTEDRAKALVAEFETRGHKQTYWCCDEMIS